MPMLYAGTIVVCAITGVAIGVLASLRSRRKEIERHIKRVEAMIGALKGDRG
jgi:hypothetical protein